MTAALVTLRKDDDKDVAAAAAAAAADFSFAHTAMSGGVQDEEDRRREAIEDSLNPKPELTASARCQKS
jgi:hypothetical protein